MQKQTFILLLVLTTLAALAVAFFWALAPLLTPVWHLSEIGSTDADLVRELWPFHLVQPEWVSTPPDYIRWAQAETLARGIVVFLSWATTAILLERRYLRSHRNTPPNTLQATAAPRCS